MTKLTLSLAVLLIAALPAPGAAQPATAALLGAGGGGTYYCIVSRCNTGTTLGAAGAFGVHRLVFMEASVRRHYCFDCDRFVTAELGVQLRRPGGRFEPFVAAGYGTSSDPELMGTEYGLYAAAGASLWAQGHWGLQAEVRGRQVGRGDAMGEASLLIARRFPRL